MDAKRRDPDATKGTIMKSWLENRVGTSDYSWMPTGVSPIFFRD